MSEQIMCSCGEVLVDDVSSRGVKPVGTDVFVEFRRTTDYVMCLHCMRSYNVPELIEKAESAETIEDLERLVEQQRARAADTD